MGTRGLYCVVQDDKFKVAQYGQWDAYPSGQGLDILSFLRAKPDEGNIDAFKDKIRALKQLTNKASASLWEDLDKNPQLSRDTCAQIMTLIDEGKVSSVHLQAGFAADSLFCEWAYVINLDEDVLEVYRGFQEAAHDKGRFADYEVEERQKGKYWPVAEVVRFPFDRLPDDQSFEGICEGNVLDRLAHLEHEA